MRISDWSSDVCSSDLGKTEIARRLAKLANAPFVKVEATKFTEVGYVGKDVETIVRDLVETAVKMTREQAIKKLRDRAETAAEDRVLDVLLPPPKDFGEASSQRQNESSAARQVFRKRSEEHTSELQSLMRISYAVFCLKKKKN